jgi:hypothetical protein
MTDRLLAHTHLEQTWPTHARDFAINICREIERPLLRLEPTLVHTWNEVGRRTDLRSLLVVLVRQQLETRIEEVAPYERRRAGHS